MSNENILLAILVFNLLWLFMFIIHGTAVLQVLGDIKEKLENETFVPDDPPCERCAGTGEYPGFSNELGTCPKCNGSGYASPEDKGE